MAKRQQVYIRYLGEISHPLKFFQEKNKQNKFEEYDYLKYADKDPERLYIEAYSIMETLDGAMQAKSFEDTLYEPIVQNVIGYHKDRLSNASISLRDYSTMSPDRGHNWSVNTNAPIIHALSPDFLRKLYEDDKISAFEEKLIKNCLIVKRCSDLVNKSFNEQLPNLKYSKDIKNHIDLTNKIVEKIHEDLSFLNEIDQFDHYIIPYSNICRFQNAIHLKDEYNSYLKTNKFENANFFSLMGKELYDEKALRVADIKDPSYSFLIGRLHPYFLIHALSGFAEEFVDYLSPYKYEPGEVVYLRSSVTECAIELLSAKKNDWYGNRRTKKKIKQSTVKNSCGGIIVNYASKEKSSTRLKSYVINLFDPSETISVSEKHLNYLQKKRRVKDSDDDLMDTPL